MYRAVDELEAMHARDPILIFQNQLIADGLMTELEVSALEDELRQDIRAAYREASEQVDPLAVSYTHLTLPTILLV